MSQQQIERLRNTLRLARDIKRGAIRTRVYMPLYTAYKMAIDTLLSAPNVHEHCYPTSYGHVDAPFYVVHVDDGTAVIEAHTIFSTVAYQIDLARYKGTHFDGRIKHTVGEVEAEDILHVFNVEPFDDYLYVFDTEHNDIQLATYRGRRHDGVYLYTSLYNPAKRIELSEELHTATVSTQPELISLNDFF